MSRFGKATPKDIVIGQIAFSKVFAEDRGEID
jgi:hypothetical protein